MAGKHLAIFTLSNFYITLVLDGLQKLCGLIVFELLQSSKTASRQNVYTPFIFSWVVSNVIASFSGILIHKTRVEYVIFLGVLLSAMGTALCMLSLNIKILTVFWGLIFGSGHGLASSQVSKYFKTEKFSLQVASSFGVVIMPLVFQVLNSWYGLQGSFLIFCGIILNYIPLTLTSSYNFPIPKIKWRVRKKSNQYSIEGQNGSQAVSVESFTNSLEPDLIVKISQDDELLDENLDNGERSSKHVAELGTIQLPVGRKRSETRGKDLQGLDTYTNFFSRNITNSQLTVEIKKYEKDTKVLEDNLNSEDNVDDGVEPSKTDNNCDITNSIKMLENILHANIECDAHRKSNQLPKITEHEIADNEKSDSENVNIKKNSLALKHAAGENTTLKSSDSSIDAHQINGKQQNEISSNTEQNKKLKPSPYILEKKEKVNVPLNIKVHVEECIFKTDEDDWDESFNKYLETKSDYKNKESFINKNEHFKQFSKFSDLHKHKFSKIYSISEFSDNMNVLTEKKGKGKDTKQALRLLNKILSKVFLCILVIEIIFQINLVTLLTMLADFGNDIDNTASDFKWILVVFGIGGLIGKICCCRITNKVAEKYNSIGVVLFLLTGLSTAGILYSPDLKWLAGFYCILGALEGGITYIVSKCTLEYTDKDMHIILSSIKSFLTGVALICIPYIIGMFRDDLGDYEFLLQILS